MKYVINALFFLSPVLTQVSDLKITVLSTMVADYDYIGEWGFSALVESDKKRILFDTGFRPKTNIKLGIKKFLKIFMKK